jgi:hypothetical protein
MKTYGTLNRVEGGAVLAQAKVVGSEARPRGAVIGSHGREESCAWMGTNATVYVCVCLGVCGYAPNHLPPSNRFSPQERHTSSARVGESLAVLDDDSKLPAHA